VFSILSHQHRQAHIPSHYWMLRSAAARFGGNAVGSSEYLLVTDTIGHRYGVLPLMSKRRFLQQDGRRQEQAHGQAHGETVRTHSSLLLPTLQVDYLSSPA